MTKSQFNIKISKDLLHKVKRQAMMSGKSLTEHITDLVTKSLSDEGFPSSNNSLEDRLNGIDHRLLRIESKLSNFEYLSPAIKPFTNSEAIKCTNFMKGLFNLEVEKRNFDDKNKAFDDLMLHVSTYVEFNNFLVDRFKGIMLNNNPSPWTGKELNDMAGNNKCNCPIRQELITWTGNFNCLSQQVICERGVDLLSLL